MSFTSILKKLFNAQDTTFNLWNKVGIKEKYMAIIFVLNNIVPLPLMSTFVSSPKWTHWPKAPQICSHLLLCDCWFHYQDTMCCFLFLAHLLLKVTKLAPHAFINFCQFCLSFILENTFPRIMAMFSISIALNLGIFNSSYVRLLLPFPHVLVAPCSHGEF